MEDILSSIDGFRQWLKQSAKPPADAARFLTDRIAAMDKNIRAFARMDTEGILERASALEKTGEKGRLWGVPIGIKDNICIKDALTTCASRILEGFRPPYNAAVIERLSAEGALLIDGANMDEFAFGSSCETSCYGPTKNPWSPAHIPGGSSGGSAAAVAGGEVAAAIGSDTGGSIRQPAAMCGVVGLKPTYGRVSRYGLIAFASSLDQIGPITRNVADCAAMLEVISGYDHRDSTSVNRDVPRYTESLSQSIEGLTIGIPGEYFTPGIDEGVKDRVDEAIRVFRDLGAETIDISLPHTKYAVSCYYIIAPAEASSNLARYDGVHYGHRSPDAGELIEMYTASRNEGFGTEAKRRILLGTYSLSSGYYEAYYLKAQKVRTRISDDFREAFKACDCILTPTSPTTAFKIGERMEDPLTMYLSDIFTIPANLAGLPAVSIPCGMAENGLPAGLQLMAAPFNEEVLIKSAHAFERSTDHHTKVPAFS
ncbi:MAG: Asp-tRNA(Asn)/Glu-tRNA(Gln) amidotransferase GatCAB subunit A [Candidatus Makaraimicrobium thalassicum]|nr:MAG: Asp-tRNA(Asn)/Glu-tRNA(Gln) amidotransferase GatCAB subunit A [Candidatus Omnitrophota bacterium]